MTSQCGSDSPDGGAVMSEIETAIFTIITSAGEARASLYQALDKARAGEMAESEQCMIEADTQLKRPMMCRPSSSRVISTARCRCRFCSSMPKIS